MCVCVHYRSIMFWQAAKEEDEEEDEALFIDSFLRKEKERRDEQWQVERLFLLFLLPIISYLAVQH